MRKPGIPNESIVALGRLRDDPTCGEAATRFSPAVDAMRHEPSATTRVFASTRTSQTALPKPLAPYSGVPATGGWHPPCIHVLAVTTQLVPANCEDMPVRRTPTNRSRPVAASKNGSSSNGAAKPGKPESVGEPRLRRTGQRSLRGPRRRARRGPRRRPARRFRRSGRSGGRGRRRSRDRFRFSRRQQRIAHRRPDPHVPDADGRNPDAQSGAAKSRRPNRSKPPAPASAAPCWATTSCCKGPSISWKRSRTANCGSIARSKSRSPIPPKRSGLSSGWPRTSITIKHLLRLNQIDFRIAVSTPPQCQRKASCLATPGRPPQ